jgi:hypothetical protein
MFFVIYFYLSVVSAVIGKIQADPGSRTYYENSYQSKQLTPIGKVIATNTSATERPETNNLASEEQQNSSKRQEVSEAKSDEVAKEILNEGSNAARHIIYLASCKRLQATFEKRKDELIRSTGNLDTMITKLQERKVILEASRQKALAQLQPKNNVNDPDTAFSNEADLLKGSQSIFPESAKSLNPVNYKAILEKLKSNPSLRVVDWISIEAVLRFLATTHSDNLIKSLQEAQEVVAETTELLRSIYHDSFYDVTKIVLEKDQSTQPQNPSYARCSQYSALAKSNADTSILKTSMESFFVEGAPTYIHDKTKEARESHVDSTVTLFLLEVQDDLIWAESAARDTVASCQKKLKNKSNDLFNAANESEWMTVLKEILAMDSKDDLVLNELKKLNGYFTILDDANKIEDPALIPGTCEKLNLIKVLSPGYSNMCPFTAKNELVLN